MEIKNDRELLHLVDQLGATADALAGCPSILPRPLASYVLLDALAGAQRNLAIVFDQLARWHGEAIDGTDFKGDGTEPCGPDRAQAALALAAVHAGTAEDSVLAARTANGTTRWYDTSRSARISMLAGVDELTFPTVQQLPATLRAV